MSDLQIGLLIIGAVTIAAVIAYNKIQDLKYRRLADKNFASNHEDALLESGEDSVRPLAAGQSHDGFEPPVNVVAEPPRIEPTLINETVPSRVENTNAGATSLPLTSEECDAIFWDVHMSASQALNAARIGQAFDAFRESFSKPLRLQACPPSSHGWIDANGANVDSYLFKAGIQLVDRQGPIDNDELARFGSLATGFAGDWGLEVKGGDSIESNERARKIDEFCCDVDIQIVLHLVGLDKPFAGTKIRAIAESEGFQVASDGLFRRFDENGHCLYSLANDESGAFRLDSMKDTTSSSISLQFDLPRVPGGIAAFDQFCSIASRFATTLGARLVDDNNVEIGAGALKSIRAQVEQVQTRMNSAGFPPGSTVALRLFS